MTVVNVCSCREAERASSWSAKLFWEQVLLLNRPCCSVLQKAAICCKRKETKKRQSVPDTPGEALKISLSMWLKWLYLPEKNKKLKNTYLHIHVCGVHTHTSHSSISLCLDTTFVLLPVKTLKGYWSVGNTQVFTLYDFISLQNCISTSLLLFWLYCCSFLAPAVLGTNTYKISFC